MKATVSFSFFSAVRSQGIGPGIHAMPLGTVGVSAVDVRDIAEATSIAITTDGHHGKTYNLNGPDVLSGARVIDLERVAEQAGALRWP